MSINIKSKSLTEEIESYIKDILKNSNCRFLSWEHCYNAFGNKKLDDDTLALHLGFYLASWGMYRGSTKLLQRDYQVHVPVVKIIKKYQNLRCERGDDVKEEYILKILELKKEIAKAYQGFIPSDTLITKIILGTLGCVPALDRYFIVGTKTQDISGYTLNEKTMKQLFKFISENEIEIKKAQTKLKDRAIYYSKMKVVDMYFWQLGYRIDEEKERNKKKKS